MIIADNQTADLTADRLEGLVQMLGVNRGGEVEERGAIAACNKGLAILKFYT